MSGSRDENLAQNFLDDTPPDAGIFSWDLTENLLFADRAVAALFGLPKDQTAHGLPVEDYLARVHPDDRPELARAISQSITDDIPQQHTYRVKGDDDCFRAVTAFGRAFGPQRGSPRLYSGIIIPAGEPERSDVSRH